MENINFDLKLENYEECKAELFKLLSFLPDDAAKEAFLAGYLKKVLML